jgi:hypothetical protein
VAIPGRAGVGPFAPAALLRDRDRAVLLSALRETLFFDRYALGSEPIARRRLDRLGRSDDEADFGRWSEHLVGAAGTSVRDEDLSRDLREPGRLGALALVDTFHALDQRVEYGDARLSEATRLLAARLDTRPRHRYELAAIAHHPLLDLVLCNGGTAPRSRPPRGCSRSRRRGSRTSSATGSA